MRPFEGEAFLHSQMNASAGPRSAASKGKPVSQFAASARARMASSGSARFLRDPLARVSGELLQDVFLHGAHAFAASRKASSFAMALPLSMSPAASCTPSPMLSAFSAT